MSKPEEILAEIKADLKRVTDEVKSTAEDALRETKNIGKVSAETKSTADELLAKHAAAEARLTEVEQKLVARGSGRDEAARTTGQIFVENEEVKAFMAKAGRGSVRVNVSRIITSGGGSAGALVEPQRIPGIITPPERRLVVRDLLTPGRTSSNSVEYVRETGFTNSARPVTEGAAKPESNITFTSATSSVRTIAHWVQATRQILADAPMLQSYIDGRLRYGLAYVEEQQLLKGDGTGQNLYGIVPQASAYSPSFTPAHRTPIDVLRLALLQAFLAEYPPSGIVLNPIDWAKIELTKDEEGRYIFANPTGLAGPVMWGRPVVETQAMDPDEFLVGAFRLGAQIFDREDATVEISTEDRDNFIKNMVTILAEERLALAVYRPEAFVTGEFPAVSG